jgi:hypothetical protein
MQAYLAGVKFLLQRLAVFVSAEIRACLARLHSLPRILSFSVRSMPDCIGSCYHARGCRAVSSPTDQIFAHVLIPACWPEFCEQENIRTVPFHGPGPPALHPFNCLFSRTRALVQFRASTYIGIEKSLESWLIENQAIEGINP